jgi:uncharacterized protein YbjT (DUF2867 family)
MSNSKPNIKRVLLTGATGFVGGHLYPVLVEAGFEVVCGTRHPDKARKQHPDRHYVALDVYDQRSTLSALQGCDAAIYLVHAMTDHKDYDAAEERAAQIFSSAAGQAGLSRIVYLGGIRPVGKTSRHLKSRLRTGEILRMGSVPTIELQASMIIGAGSESWRIVRDLAARLPFMLLPTWLDNKSQPIDISDVTAAICRALSIDAPASAAYALPGQEIMSAREIIERTAKLMGVQPRMLRVPLLSPRLSSYWIALVTRANGHVARQLVEGLCTNLVAADEGLWRLMPNHKRVPFDEAARRALQGEARGLPLRTRLTEWVIHRMTPAVTRTKGLHKGATS